MTYAELRKQMILNAGRNNIPILGEFELTAQCNFKCSMCYVANNQTHNLSTESWMRIFDQAVEAGLVFALLTGGELFMRHDFKTLYNYLYDKGVKVTLFTNGTLITDEIMNILIKRPPEFIAITLYGASDDTYKIVTGQNNGFKKVSEAITKIQKARLNLILRTIPIKPIYDTIDSLIDFVKNKGLILNYVTYITPSNNTQTARLNINALIDFETRIQAAFDYKEDPTLISTKQSTCAAMKSAYFINYQGLMQPCALAYKPARSVLDEPFMDVFLKVKSLYEVQEKNNHCKHCDLNSDCFQCYARRLHEDMLDGCPDYLSAYARKEGDRHDT